MPLPDGSTNDVAVQFIAIFGKTANILHDVQFFNNWQITKEVMEKIKQVIEQRYSKASSCPVINADTLNSYGLEGFMRLFTYYILLLSLKFVFLGAICYDNLTNECQIHPPYFASI